MEGAPAEVPAGRGAGDAEAGSRGTGVRVLVVDDNEDNAESLALLLRLTGHDVRVAPDGPFALAEAERHRPRLALPGIGLPGMSGYEVAGRLCRQAGMAGAVVVAMTGYGQPEDRQKSEEAGFSGHIVKPADPATLAGLLESVARPDR